MLGKQAEENESICIFCKQFFSFVCKRESKTIRLYFNPLIHNAPKNQTYFKNLGAFAAKFLKCVIPFWDVLHERVNTYYKPEILRN